MAYIIGHGTSKHYSFPVDVWGPRKSYIDLDVCLFNQKRHLKLPQNTSDNRELVAVVHMLHHTANEIGRLVKEHEARSLPNGLNRKAASA
jgi:7,8-dihydro-6-hydroxymethylpterin-pyrophosphokinase